MGRHSLPGPGESAHEPSDESFAGNPYRGDASDPRHSGGYRAGDGYRAGPAHSGDRPSGGAGWFDEQRDWDEHRQWDDSHDEWHDSRDADEHEDDGRGRKFQAIAKLTSGSSTVSTASRVHPSSE